MEINKNERGILEVNDARICYLNFSGVGTKYNREGDRNFALIIPDQELADMLSNDGWNIKVKPPRDVDDTPFMYMPVKIKFNANGPAAYLRSGENTTRLNEETIGVLDDIAIASVSMDIRPYDWEVNGQTGRTAYLQAIEVIQRIDRFGARYEEEGRL